MIELPENVQAPKTIEEQLAAAMYSASMYHRVTKIKQGHRVAYLISEHLLAQFAPDLMKDVD